MGTIKFENKEYKKMPSEVLMECYNIFDIIDRIRLGEYAEYHDKYLFKTDRGMIAAYKEDLSNRWEI